VPADVPIIVQGETGTGKEGMAALVHASSGRRGPLIAVNCAALPTELAEAELFGYRKGAFTGAHDASPGLFRSAEGRTLFLDEITDLPLGLQAKLLRVLESRAGGPAAAPRRKTDDDTEFEALIGALRTNGGSVARAASALRISRARACRLLTARPDFSLEDVRKA